MCVIRQGTRVSVCTPAKLNLFLELKNRRTDGYHELDTLMVPINLYDQLVLSSRDDAQINLHCSWSSAAQSSAATFAEAIPSVEQNLVFKALKRLQSASGCQRGADVLLTKRIPVQAGMGGGSSDAMAALVAGNLAWDLGWSSQRLGALGAELGSDVPFFAAPTLARCTGRGEQVQSLRAPGRMHFVVVKPAWGLSTADVFRQASVPSHPHSSASILAAIATMDLSAIGKHLFNRLQHAAAVLTPWVDQIHRVMQRLSVLGHQLSGSGTSYFALCRNHRHARHVAGQLRATGLGQVFAVTSFGLSSSS